MARSRPANDDRQRGEVDPEGGLVRNRGAAVLGHGIGPGAGGWHRVLASSQGELMTGGRERREDVARALGSLKATAGLDGLGAAERQDGDEAGRVLAARQQSDEVPPGQCERLGHLVVPGSRAADVAEGESGVIAEARELIEEQGLDRVGTRRREYRHGGLLASQGPPRTRDGPVVGQRAARNVRADGQRPAKGRLRGMMPRKGAELRSRSVRGLPTNSHSTDAAGRSRPRQEQARPLPASPTRQGTAEGAGPITPPTTARGVPRPSLQRRVQSWLQVAPCPTASRPDSSPYRPVRPRCPDIVRWPRPRRCRIRYRHSHGPAP